MPTVETSIEIAASPDIVWSVAGDPSLVSKIFPDVISATTTPPGMATVGQKTTLVGKVAGRRIQGIFETTEVVPNKKLVVKQTSGSVIKSYFSTLTLEPTKKGTRVSNRVDFEPAGGYLGKVLSALVINRTVKRNILASVNNIKELAELKELPSQTG